MNRAALVTFLAFACADAAAEWTPVGGNQKIFNAYADKSSVRKTDDGAQMLALYDFLMADVSADGQPHASTVVLREYDCVEKRVRLLAYVDYAGNMGAGRVISPAGARGPARWEQVAGGSLDAAFLAIACARAG